MSELYSNNDWRDYQSLTHFGIPGMKWGVRRYQNKDGSLTAAGRKRYSELSGREKLKVDKAINKRDMAANGVINASPLVKELSRVDTSNKSWEEKQKIEAAFKRNYDVAINSLKAHKKAEDFLSKYDDVPLSRLDSKDYSGLKTMYDESPYRKAGGRTNDHEYAKVDTGYLQKDLKKLKSMSDEDFDMHVLEFVETESDLDGPFDKDYWKLRDKYMDEYYKRYNEKRPSAKSEIAYRASKNYDVDKSESVNKVFAEYRKDREKVSDAVIKKQKDWTKLSVKELEKLGDEIDEYIKKYGPDEEKYKKKVYTAILDDLGFEYSEENANYVRQLGIFEWD